VGGWKVNAEWIDDLFSLDEKESLVAFGFPVQMSSGRRGSDGSYIKPKVVVGDHLNARSETDNTRRQPGTE
jgi:hypothetical protein